MDVILDGAKWSINPEKFFWKYQSMMMTEFAEFRINGHHYFVKRQPKPFSGQQLLVQAISNYQIKHCPRVAAIAKDNGHYYYFTEFLNGDVLAEKSYLVGGEKLINNLFAALYSINKLGFWYSDLCLKNIFMTTTGNYYLIDIDSCFPYSEKFHINLNISYDYPAVLVKFGKEMGLGMCNLAKGHNGECMNQAMLIALAIDVRHSFTIPLTQKDSVIHRLLLGHYEKDYMGLFAKLINELSDWPGTRRLIDKILM
jgi:hypothetical protein